MEFIDWFAGIGGFHTGLEQAGMICAGYCEIDTYARRSMKENFKGMMSDTENLFHTGRRANGQ
ncbi:DNA cytosine methyltransferase [Veillonella magna]|uniref:DNA cytosine methyltransferase n=1 Tax=Veillonella magna TaxID=464322 RepID=A0ABS2GFD2_9FIRM|nr:DNA cytosine methyltransferase [Veillonella magna]MBM6823510.1 DNA cytosine methyltransferase [Veillonella magna]MBM6911854.1 DNA cytosine methyltransferase [Veillonella magna]